MRAQNYVFQAINEKLVGLLVVLLLRLAILVLLSNLREEARGFLLCQRWVQNGFGLDAQRSFLIVESIGLLLNIVCIMPQAFETLFVAIRSLHCPICWLWVLAVGLRNHKVDLLLGNQVSWLLVQELLHLPILNFIQNALQQLLEIILTHNSL